MTETNSLFNLLSYNKEAKMTIFNPKSKGFRSKAHKNFMNGNSYDITNPIARLRLAASSCFFGEPQYYHRDASDKRPSRNNYSDGLSAAQVDRLRDTLNAKDPREWRGLTPSELMESAIDAALDFDAEATLQEAVRLRTEENIRTTPQVILVRASRHVNVKGTGLIRKYARSIVSRADEPTTCVAYHLAKFGKNIPSSLKRALGDRFSAFSEYQLGKNKLESRAVKAVDAVNLVHPKHTPALEKLIKGDLNITGQTWETIISTKGSSQETWEEALEVMGHMALLRNLRNLVQNNVNEDYFLTKLVEGATGKQLPFRYYSAYRALRDAGVNNPKILEALEDCLVRSFKNIPNFSGRVMSLCDNSGSAHGTATSSMGTMTVSTIGNLTGIITGMVSDEGYVGVFGDLLKITPVIKRDSVFTQLRAIEEIGRRIGHGTEHGVWTFWHNAIVKKEHWDTVFIYSDMQAGHGGLYGNKEDYREFLWTDCYHIDVPKLISKYRSEVNPNVKVFCVQIAGYQDTIIPEFYDKTYILGGWGDGLLKFASEIGNIVI